MAHVQTKILHLIVLEVAIHDISGASGPKFQVARTRPLAVRFRPMVAQPHAVEVGPVVVEGLGAAHKHPVFKYPIVALIRGWPRPLAAHLPHLGRIGGGDCDRKPTVVAGFVGQPTVERYEGGLG